MAEREAELAGGVSVPRPPPSGATLRRYEDLLVKHEHVRRSYAQVVKELERTRSQLQEARDEGEALRCELDAAIQAMAEVLGPGGELAWLAPPPSESLLLSGPGVLLRRIRHLEAQLPPHGTIPCSIELVRDMAAQLGVAVANDGTCTQVTELSRHEREVLDGIAGRVSRAGRTMSPSDEHDIPEPWQPGQPVMFVGVQPVTGSAYQLNGTVGRIRSGPHAGPLVLWCLDRARRGRLRVPEGVVVYECDTELGTGMVERRHIVPLRPPRTPQADAFLRRKQLEKKEDVA